jgi:hypothetical protein
VFTCASRGLGCQSATACPASYPSPLTSNLQNGCLFAQTNGFVPGGVNGQTVSIEANTGNPPTVAGLASGSSRYYVTVRIAQQNPLTFGRIFGSSFLPVVARATASVASLLPPNCVTTLNPSASGAFSLSGTSSVVLNNCSLAVNSSSSSALSGNNNSSLAARSISIVGGVSDLGSISPSPITGAQAAPDPLANLAPPSFSSGCDYINFNVSSTVTLNPGVYCGGIKISGSSTITFNPGTYILLGGGLSVSGQAQLVGTGVLFYNTFNATYSFDSLSLTGGGLVNLTAPPNGILYFEDRNAPTGNIDTIAGNATWTLTGSFYLPQNQLKITGGGLASGQPIAIVANTITLSGNSSIDINPGTPSAPRITPQIKSMLLE